MVVEESRNENSRDVTVVAVNAQDLAHLSDILDEICISGIHGMLFQENPHG